MSDTSLRFNFLEGRNTAIPAMAKTAAAIATMDRQIREQTRNTRRTNEANSQELFRIDNTMRNTARRMVSRFALIGGAIAAASGQAVAFTAAIWPMVGALGAIPAIMVGGIAGIAAMVLGFNGLFAAMKKTGGGAGQSAQQIVAAEHRIETAHRSVTDAQRALNDAYEEASDRLRDITVQYARSQLDQREAAQAVRDAQEALKQARRSGDINERRRAELALQSALLSQTEVANRLSDVTQEYQDRLAKGVEGSDEVRDATRQQADAAYELADAQRALVEAQKGGGGAAAQAQAYAKLSAEGKQLVDMFKALAPSWRSVQQLTQASMFAGVAGDVKALSTAYLPVMSKQLPAIAQGWNNMFRSIAGVASTAGFVKDMDRSLGLQATMWQRIGSSFGPFLSGFRHWVSVGSEFLPRLGSWVQRLADRFELWSIRVRESGEAYRWIDNAIKTGHEFNELIKSWGRSLFTVFQYGQNKSLLNNLIEGSQAFERWLKTAEGQERITQMWERMRDVGSAAWKLIKSALDLLAQTDISGIAVALETTAQTVALLSHAVVVLNPLLKVVVPLFVELKLAALAAKVATSVFAISLKTLLSAFSLLVVPMNRFGLETAQNTQLMMIQKGVMTANAAQWAHVSDAIALASAKTAAAGIAMAALSGGAVALGYSLMRGGGTVEGIVVMGVGLVGLGKNIFQVVIPAIRSMVVNLGVMRTAMYSALGVVGLLVGGLLLFSDALGLSNSDRAVRGILRTSAAFDTARMSLEEYSDTLRAQTDPLFRYSQAQEAAAEAQERYNDAVKEFGPNSDQATAALRDSTQAALDLQDAQSDLAKVNGPELQKWLENLHDTGKLTNEQFDYLSAQLKDLPKLVADANGGRVGIKVDLIPVVVGSAQAWVANVMKNLKLPSFDSGGTVPGPKGSPQLIIAHGGEVVSTEKQAMAAPRQASSGGGIRIFFDIPSGSDYDLDRALASRIRRFVRVQGGGNVQVAFGSTGR